MTDRLDLRPDLQLPTDDSKPDEVFQNVTLRPILKMQHDLLLAVFQHHLLQRKVDLDQFPQPQRREKMEQLLQKDNRLRELLRGCVIGHFTMEEWQYYAENTGEINKRIMALLGQKLRKEYL